MKNIATSMIVLLICHATSAQASAAERVLNNLVTELVNHGEQTLAGRTMTPFANPRDGWCYFEISGDATVRLNDEPEPLLTGETSQAMRHLPTGQHTLRLEGRPRSLVVCTIPALQHAFYNGGDRWNLNHGPFDDWDYLTKHVLANVNVIISGGARHPLHYDQTPAGVRWIGLPEVPAWYAREDHLDYWKSLGRSWITSITVPAGEDITAEQAYAFWSAAFGLNEPRMDGVIVDEFPGGDQPKYDAYRQAVERIYAEPKFKGKTFSPYSCGGGGILSGYTGKDRCQEFSRAAMAGGGYICIERYLSEQPTEALAKAHLHEEFIAGWNMPRFEKDFPGVARQTVMVLGCMSAVGESLNVHPSVDFKVYMDMQMHLLANDPAYAGLGGLQWYLTAYADDETMRWASRLFRHYAIEGNKQMLSPKFGFRYQLDHLINPDFTEQTSGWDLQPAEPDSIAVKEHAQYGYLQFRYAPDGVGDRFLVTRRSASGPNTFSQTISNLTPGRLYSLKLVTADYQDLVAERQDKKLHAVSIAIDGVEPLPGEKMSFQAVFPNHYARPVGAFRGDERSYYMNYHWRVFRAQSATALLRVADWHSESDPGGPVGQELMYNFIEVQPYFAD